MFDRIPIIMAGLEMTLWKCEVVEAARAAVFVSAWQPVRTQGSAALTHGHRNVSVK